MHMEAFRRFPGTVRRRDLFEKGKLGWGCLWASSAVGIMVINGMDF